MTEVSSGHVSPSLDAGQLSDWAHRRQNKRHGHEEYIWWKGGLNTMAGLTYDDCYLQGVCYLLPKLHTFLHETLEFERLSFEATFRRLQLIDHLDALEYYHGCPKSCKVADETLYFDASSAYLTENFVLLPKSSKTTMARRGSYSASLRQHLAAVGDNLDASHLDSHVTIADLTNPDHMGWLTDQSTGKTVWCVVADMLFCIFASDTAVTTQKVLLLPGFDVRAMIFHKPMMSAITKQSNFQFLLSSDVTGQEYCFSTNSKDQFESWVSLLKIATSLDTAIFEDERTHEVNSSDLTKESSNLLEFLEGNADPGYIPSPKQARKRTDNLDVNLDLDNASHARRDSFSSSRSGVSRARTNESPTTDNSSNVSDSPRESAITIAPLSALKADKKDKLLQSEPEKIQLSYSGLPVTIKRSQSTRDDRERIHSLDPHSSPKTVIGRRPGLGSKIVRTASSLKDMVFKNKGKSSLSAIIGKDGRLTDVQISGFLQHKHLLKWTRYWCIISRGKFYALKSQNNYEEIALEIQLNEATVVVAENDKNRKSYVFKLCREGAKSAYLSASDDFELNRWLQVLKYETGQRPPPQRSKRPSIAEFNSQKSPLRYDARRPTPSSLTSNETSNVARRRKTEKSLPDKSKYHSMSALHFDKSTNPSQFSISLSESNKLHLSLENLTARSESPCSRLEESTTSSVTDFGDSLLKDNEVVHDESLAQVWSNDKSYQLQKVRMKSPRMDMNDYDVNDHGAKEHEVKGANNEDMLLVHDEGIRVVKKRRDTLTHSCSESNLHNLNSCNKHESLSSSDTNLAKPDFNDDQGSADEEVFEVEKVRKQLLRDVLAQKEELEKKQDKSPRTSRHMGNRTSTNFSDPLHSSAPAVEAAIRDITYLKQRRTSTWLQMKSLEKQLQQSPLQKSTKSSFSMGFRTKTKSQPLSSPRDQQFLQSQIQALRNKLENIEKGLSVQNERKVNLEKGLNGLEALTNTERNSLHEMVGAINVEVPVGLQSGNLAESVDVSSAERQTPTSNGSPHSNKSRSKRSCEKNGLSTSMTMDDSESMDILNKNTISSSASLDSGHGSEFGSPQHSVAERVSDSPNESSDIISPRTLREIQEFEEMSREILRSKNSTEGAASAMSSDDNS